MDFADIFIDIIFGAMAITCISMLGIMFVLFIKDITDDYKNE